MNFQLHETIKNWLLHLTRRQKKVILQLNDVIMTILALIAAFSVRFGVLFLPDSTEQFLVFAAAPVIGVVCLTYSGLYQRITRHSGTSGSKRIFAGVTLTVLIWLIFVFLTDIDIVTIRGVPRSVVVLFWVFSFIFIWVSREFASWFLSGNKFSGNLLSRGGADVPAQSVLIYGYSESALQLMRRMRNANSHHPVGIVDTDDSLHFQKVDNFRIFPETSLEDLIEKEEVTDIFLDSAIVPRQERFEIVRRLESYPVTIKILPSIEDIVSGTIAIEQVKNIRVEDILGRSAIPHDKNLLRANVENKVVLVTGAGGSIGSELVRQLVRLNPVKLVLFEISEIALYTITAEIGEILEKMRLERNLDSNYSLPEIISTIGSVTDEMVISHTIKSHKVQTIYHAAAYKHVPIVEDNPVPGLENNSFGTWTIAKVAQRYSVERFVLISTDKAVRPTNIMGASKRLAEMALQGMADEGGETTFCIVRFGNVLDSSGSVVPKFRKQIEHGGPVTVTHPNVIRYFMSIKEAVGLVIQAGTLAKAGAIFVLDMGEPVKITDLARTMIKLSELRVRDENNPDGNIEISFTGLRPGEKLYEELLIGDDTAPTKHPRISELAEPFLPLSDYTAQMARLHKLMNNYDQQGIKRFLCEIVEGYEPVENGPVNHYK